jgi:parallel beta-helix repeat protein
MRSNAKKKITILITLGMIFASFSLIVIICSANIYDMTLDNKNLKISAVSGKIHIDNNWTAAKAAGICTGNGTYSEPYVIEDLVIDGGGSGSCILIENSDMYFKIRNCSVYNSRWGIELTSVTNAQLIDNNCSSNNYGGIYLGWSNNNTISNNNANYNYYYAIYLNWSNNNTISNNNANYNYFIGIRIGYYSDNNILSDNNACYHNLYGIYLQPNYNNTLSGNNACYNNDYGIYLQGSDNNTLSDNNASYNNDCGIYLSSSYSNTLSGNNASYNNDYGIYLSGLSNTLLENNASYNKDSGIFIIHGGFNFLSGNTVKNNSLNGVYLKESRNNIIEGNFILNNEVGIYMEYTLSYFDNFKSPDNEISNNIFNGNNQDIREVFHVFVHHYDSLRSLMITLLSIAIVGIIITSLTIELITKLRYPRNDEIYHPSIYGISALVVESVGTLLFILGAIFLIPIDSVFHWLIILIPFSVVGIIISRKGLKKDEKKFSAGLGMGFGIGLLILNFQLILSGLFIIILVIAIVYIAVLFVRLCLD